MNSTNPEPNDGGQFFPTPPVFDDRGATLVPAQPGATLRAQMALGAMMGFLAGGHTLLNGKPMKDQKDIAIAACAMADAMIAQLEK